MSYKGNDIECFETSSFTQHKAFEIYPSCCMYNVHSFFYFGVVFYCMDGLIFAESLSLHKKASLCSHWILCWITALHLPGCPSNTVQHQFVHTWPPTLVFFPTKNQFLLPHPIVLCMYVSLGRDHLSVVIRMNVLIETVFSLRPAAVFICLRIPRAQPKVLVRAHSKSS